MDAGTAGVGVRADGRRVVVAGQLRRDQAGSVVEVVRRAVVRRLHLVVPAAHAASPGRAGPQVALSYSSQSVDGRTAATNNQGSWIGEGFGYEPGYIERRYKSCATTATSASADLCWSHQNATLCWTAAPAS